MSMSKETIKVLAGLIDDNFEARGTVISSNGADYPIEVVLAELIVVLKARGYDLVLAKTLSAD